MIRKEHRGPSTTTRSWTETVRTGRQPKLAWRAGLAGLVVLFVICFSMVMNLDRSTHAAPGIELLWGSPQPGTGTGSAAKGSPGPWRAAAVNFQQAPSPETTREDTTGGELGTPQSSSMITPTLGSERAVAATSAITLTATPVQTATPTLTPTVMPTTEPSATAAFPVTPTATLVPEASPTSPAMATHTPASTPTPQPGSAPTAMPTATIPPPTGLPPVNTATATPTASPPPASPLPVKTAPAKAVATATATSSPLPPVSPTPTTSPAPPPMAMEEAIEAVPLPTATAPAPAPTDVPGPDDPHVAYGALTDSCASCHRSHTATGIALRTAWPEENLCFGCHASDGPGTDIQDSFASYTNTVTSYFKHDVAASNGVHRAGQTDGADFGGANRHVECEDCHEPHEATRGPAGAPMIQREMNEVGGVDPVWTAEGAPTGFGWLPQAEREYQVCFKCHSSFTTLPTYIPDGWNGSDYVSDGLRKLTSSDPLQVPDSRDMAQEFNPHNTSFHPVVTQGRNQSIPAASFVPGWDQTSMVYCSDCHGNADAAAQGDGPHGSGLLHLLVGAPQNGGQANYTSSGVGTAGNTSDQQVCFKCHEEAAYTTRNNFNTNFQKGMRNLHGVHMIWGTTCYSCHDTHGSEQEHLINFELSSDVQPYPGLDSQTAWHPAPMDRIGCSLICHGVDHDGMAGNYRYP